MGEVLVRESTIEDEHLAGAAAALIDLVASENDIARRTPAWLARKIAAGRAALALAEPPAGGNTRELVGFGYWSAWEDNRYVSHSGLVVHPDFRGRGLGRRLKEVLFASTRRQLPEATMMSLTTSPRVKRLNESFGFRVVPLDELTQDPAFWRGCETCRNFEEVRARGERCCCEGMILPPGEGPGGRA
ncbi:MAG TPA: GNAT family N-acetyltransferase [Planctomycetes bacterium]|nr:GNAT family N-acetyltransferase [Planctomycetota bacterium]